MNQPTILYLFTFALSVAFTYYWLTKRIPSRLVADQAPKSRFELVPVKSYNVPARAGGIDIIFVHGLGSNPDTTWRARKFTNTSHPTEETRPNSDQYVNWVSDFLPSDLPLERDAVYTRLQSVGTHLLEHIDGQIRQSKQEQGRFLIFVGYSYGGLVVKECVPESSATYPGVGKIGLAVDHYGLNKFESRSECYNSILSKLARILTTLVQPTKRHYSVPLETVQTFTQRDQLWKELEEKFQIRHENASVPFAVTLRGLGGAGKSQLALKSTESNVDRYSPILWIDATSEETVRSSFIRCAAEIGLADEPNNQQSAALVDDRVIRGVLRWLSDRTEMDDEWLVIVDNADDVTRGIKRIMPKRIRGRIVITSRDDHSQKLITLQTFNMVDAAYWHPTFKQTYFFGGRRYARIKFSPATNDEMISWSPHKIAEGWPSLVSIGFGTVDAILPVENSPDEMFVFHGRNVAQIKVVPETNDDSVVGGPWLIAEKFKALASTGYDTIDAAMPVPKKPGEAYIFRGNNYVRINVDTHKIVYGPAKISVEWPALTAAGFDSVDAALPVPQDDRGLTYFFRGDKYVKIEVIASAPDKPNFGPAPIQDHWKSLDWI